MEARSAERLPEGPGWRFEPKWDGFRCLAFRSGEAVELQAKSGKPLTRYFPEVAANLRHLAASPFVIDGELVVATDRGFFFDALQMRLHPAESRIRKLAAETPATLIAFDCLVDERGRDLTAEPLARRRAVLEALVARFGSGSGVELSPYSDDRECAEGWLLEAGGPLDGVVAKSEHAPYASGDRAMVKVKRIRTADCVVGGFRYGEGRDLVGSLLLGLYDQEGRLNHVGFTSAISEAERPALTRKLEALIEPPGFTGRAPGGPSRWATERSAAWKPLRPELVVEVRFDQVGDGRFRHGARLVRWRPDKSPAQCTMEQLAAPVADVAALLAARPTRN